MSGVPADVAATLFVLPPDAKFLAVADLSARIRERIGAVDEGHIVITRPGFRVTARLVPPPLAELVAGFRVPARLTDGVLRFARAHDQDPQAMLDCAFDALATLVEARLLVPDGSPDALEPAPSLAAGQAFAGYDIDALVRSLEDSEVYRARGADGERVALKIARPERPVVNAMLATEARVLERLGGADSPRLLGEGIEGGRAWVAMEWCDGVSIGMAAQKARAARDRRRLHGLVGQMLEAYGRLHAAGVLHGDIHPGNCLVRDDGRVVILDFGAARPLADASPVDPLRAGIPQFYDPQMASALLAGALPPAATPASEQYGLGTLAYLLLTGLPPIEAPAVQDELLRRVVSREPLPFVARGVAAWPAVEEVLRRALAKHPADRFPDAAEFARAFSSAGTVPSAPSRMPPHVGAAFASMVECVSALAVPAGSLDYAWFALRAALLFEDPELLAAADALVYEAAPGWAAQSVAVLVARARADQRAERAALEALSSAAVARDGRRDATRALLATVTVLERGGGRWPEGRRLAAWAGERLDVLFSGPSLARDRDMNRLVTAALALAKADAVPVRGDLRSRLDVLLRDENAGDVRLWALAYDVFADERFLARALRGRLPRQPLPCALALLRRYQVTGDARWVGLASRVVDQHARTQLSPVATAMVIAELKAPERALYPPFR